MQNKMKNEENRKITFLVLQKISNNQGTAVLTMDFKDSTQIKKNTDIFYCKVSALLSCVITIPKW